MTTGQQQPETDRLKWWEDIPLGLALVAQSYVVGLWYYRSISGAAWWVDLAVAIGAGLSLDLIVVTTVMGRRAGRSSLWSWATSLGAFLCSSLIALDRYGWEWRSGLHIAFPLVVFLYSQHLATPLKRVGAPKESTADQALGALPDRLVLAEAPDLAPEATPTQVSTPVAPALNGAQNGHNGQALDLAHRYDCPHCGQALKNKQALGAATTNGYCPACKVGRKAA